MREEIWAYDYAVIRVVPRIERGEFINVGVILSCPGQKFLEARIAPDWEKLKAFAPELEPEVVNNYLEIILKICAGDKAAGVIGQLTQRERFYWLTAVRSTIIQMSPLHPGFCADAGKHLKIYLTKWLGNSIERGRLVRQRQRSKALNEFAYVKLLDNISTSLRWLADEPSALPVIKSYEKHTNILSA